MFQDYLFDSSFFIVLINIFIVCYNFIIVEVMDHYSEKVDIEAGIEVKKKRIFELSDNVGVDEVLSKLISINPDIINKFKLLSGEYNVDGTKKVGYG